MGRGELGLYPSVRAYLGFDLCPGGSVVQQSLPLGPVANPCEMRIVRTEPRLWDGGLMRTILLLIAVLVSGCGSTVVPGTDDPGRCVDGGTCQCKVGSGTCACAPIDSGVCPE